MTGSRKSLSINIESSSPTESIQILDIENNSPISTCDENIQVDWDDEMRNRLLDVMELEFIHRQIPENIWMTHLRLTSAQNAFKEMAEFDAKTFDATLLEYYQMGVNLSESSNKTLLEIKMNEALHDAVIKITHKKLKMILKTFHERTLQLNEAMASIAIQEAMRQMNNINIRLDDLQNELQQQDQEREGLINKINNISEQYEIQSIMRRCAQELNLDLASIRLNEEDNRVHEINDMPRSPSPLELPPRMVDVHDEIKSESVSNEEIAALKSIALDEPVDEDQVLFSITPKYGNFLQNSPSSLWRNRNITPSPVSDEVKENNVYPVGS